LGGVPKKYQILTYGCQMNVRDSEIIAGLLEEIGYAKTPYLEQADLVVFNTCSVRHSAENKVFGKIGEIMALKRKRPEMVIAFGGCMAQLPDIREKLKRRGIDVVFGTHNIHELPQLIEENNWRNEPVFQVWDKEGAVVECLPSVRNTGVSAFTNIMYGCNNFCAYCIVPYTRGRERSRQPDDILAELRHIAAQGYKEVTLLGQNVNSYGRGLDEKIDFAELLERVSEIEGIERIRFTTSHPKDVSPRLIKVVAENPKVCEHIHVALQAGSNKILKRMNRGYTREHFLETVGRMKETIPGLAISTDIIVGFPGETEEDFLDTIDVVKKVRFDSAFTFMYSVRKGTLAETYGDQVSLEEKKDRLRRLNLVQYRIATELNKKLEGCIEEVLVEGPSKTDKNMLTSRTRTNKIVIFSGPDHLIGSLINVRITEAKTFSLFGEMVDQ
jgi:tRNA-2-methylthio-N6-dimethylallyladenosine synthase